MTARSLVIMLWLLAAMVFVPPVPDARKLAARVIDPAGRDAAAPRAFAYATQPDRSGFSLDALWVDFAYAAADAGAPGCAALVVGVALLALLLGMWCRGFSCALRRFLLALALGVPLAVALLYSSCFLDGRRIELGPEAAGYVRASLHAQTDRSTGLLSPRQLVRWHYERGFAVLNVSDRDRIDGARQAMEAGRAAAFQPPLLILVGEEWHGSPDVVLVHVRRFWNPKEMQPDETRLEQTVAGVRAEGGASFLAHPWSKVLPKTVDDIFEAGVDGMEVVNGVIRARDHLVRKAVRSRKAMVGVIDYKFGPHVNALTLLPAKLARTPRGVVEAIATRQTRVVYAVPGEAMTGEQWHTATLGTSGAVRGMRTLLETPLRRRAAWYPWLALVSGLWWLATRRRPRMGRRAARVVFGACCAIELLLPVAIAWPVRAAIGTIPVFYLVATAAFVAVPLLAATHALADYSAIGAQEQPA